MIIVKDIVHYVDGWVVLVVALSSFGVIIELIKEII
jgi:hypothetical protein